MKVTKRNGKQEDVKFDKILTRITKQTYGLNRTYVDPTKVAQKVIQGVYDGVSTEELDELAAEVSVGLASLHSDYTILASRLVTSRMHKNIPKKFSTVVENLYNYVHPITKEYAGLINEYVYQMVKLHKEVLDSTLVMDRDFNYDYFGINTLRNSYLLKLNGKIAETPQQMIMRVACGIWAKRVLDDPQAIENVVRTYNYMSTFLFTHATPTLFNSGTTNSQMSSCFLLTMEDSLESIYQTIYDCAMISKRSGGIAVSAHNIRAKGSYIKGTNGNSDGIVPMLKVFNETARFVNQGGGKRKGSIAIYLEPWHAEFEDFLDIRKNRGKEELRARDLFTAMWTPDLFFKRVLADADWTLFSPDEVPGLVDAYDESETEANFTKLYEKYEAQGLGRKTIKARELFQKIVNSLMETGTPYILSKDACNRKSNQKNLGTIRSSNLCTEIVEYTSADEIAVCNLASVSVPKMVKSDYVAKIDKALAAGNFDKVEKLASFETDEQVAKAFDFDLLKEVVTQIVENLNQIILVSDYTSEKAFKSNLSHMPIGIGLQGLADVFAMLKVPFGSPASKRINRLIYEGIYYAALSASIEIAKVYGTYSSYKGSPASMGLLQFDLSSETVVDSKFNVVESSPVVLSNLFDWSSLKNKLKEHGLRNSLLTTQMPVASTAQILGNSESFEPFTYNLYLRRTLSGEYVVVNKHLVKDLCTLGLWSENMKNQLILNDGSVQDIDSIPQYLKEVYKTVWEVKLKDMIDMEADRGHFICQSQSMNLFFKNLSVSAAYNALLYSWAKGNKTLLYYARTAPATSALKSLGVDISSKKELTVEPIENEEAYKAMLTRARNASLSGEDCVMCSA
jgi:ribonucleoside-diphosphate reductase alpha chain